MNPVILKMLGLSEEDFKKIQEYFTDLKEAKEKIDEIYNLVEENNILLLKILKEVRGDDSNEY